jgi:hypothetical protein
MTLRNQNSELDRNLNPSPIRESLFADRSITERTLHGPMHDELENIVTVQRVAENPIEGDTLRTRCKRTPCGLRQPAELSNQERRVVRILNRIRTSCAAER